MILNPENTLRCQLEARLAHALPRVLGLMNKNPLARSYGCLDRKYWQYKVLDFPSGMQQELARPLAWACSTNANFPGRGSETRLRSLAEAAIAATARMARSDGSLDDYFPFERALGATAYALAAVLDARRMLDWTPDAATLDGLCRMGRFLADHKETGMLANHHAITACALLDLAELSGDSFFSRAAENKIRLLQSIRHNDGWFPEYEGCDIGYQTVTLEFLARCRLRRPDLVPDDMLRDLLRFLLDFAHPDGSLGGEYASRNTFNFYPGGFALLSSEFDAAARMLARYAESLTNGTENFLEDDGVFGHMLSSWITVIQAPFRLLPSTPLEAEERAAGQDIRLRVYAGAELWQGGTGGLRVFGNLTQGGAFKIFQGKELICSDTGYCGVLTDGRRFCQNTPRASVGSVRNEAGETIITIEGRSSLLNEQRMTLFKLTGLRGLCLCFGRLRGFSPAIRKLMQSLLIYRKTKIPVLFERVIRIGKNGIVVEDHVRCEGEKRMASLYRTPDSVNIHVVTSDSFQHGNLLEWERCDVGNGQEFSQTRSFAAFPEYASGTNHAGGPHD